MDFHKLNPPFPKQFPKTADYARYVREDCEINWNLDKSEFDDRKISSKKTLWSDEFPKDKSSNFKWQVDFSPFGDTSEDSKFSSLYLNLKARKVQTPVVTSILFTIKANPTLIIKEKQLQHKFENTCGRGFQKFIEYTELRSFQVEQYFIINVKVSAQYEISCHNFEQNLIDSYEKLLEKGIFSDIIIYADKDQSEFKAHRSILTCRSTVFSYMFAHEQQDKLNRRIAVKGFTGSVVKKLLNFIYFGRTDFTNVDETLILLEMATKYDIVDLKSQCVEYLICNLNDSNALSILIKSNMYNLTDLKTTAITYMRDHKASFSDPSKYEILKMNPDLLIELTTKFINKNE